jgi:putative membrane protein
MSLGKTVALGVSSLLLTASFAAEAQNASQQPNTGTPNNGSMQSNAPDMASGSGGADGDFVAKAAEAGHEEVADARQAIKDSNRRDVKRVAAMLRRDHTMADRKLARIAKRDGLAVPPPGTAANATEAAYSDSDYIASQIKAHREAIDLFKNESQNGQNPQLKAFARQTLPTLEHHLHALEKLQNA